MRATLLASATAASFGGLRFSKASNQADGRPRPRRTCWITAVAPATSRLRNTPATFTGQWVPRSVSHLGSIDPTICCPLAAPAQPVRRTRRPADLLSGECLCARHPRAIVTFARRHQLPCDAGNLVGERHRREFWRLALQQGEQPGRRTAAAAPHLLDHRGRPRHQQAAQHTGDLYGPMGPTECLAPRIDRSYHLLSSCSSGSTGAANPPTG